MKRVYAYYFRSESGDDYLNMEISEEGPMTVYEAMDKFGWDGGTESWLKYNGCDSVDEIPYDEFIVNWVEI